MESQGLSGEVIDSDECARRIISISSLAELKSFVYEGPCRIQLDLGYWLKEDEGSVTRQLGTQAGTKFSRKSGNGELVELPSVSENRDQAKVMEDLELVVDFITAHGCFIGSLDFHSKYPIIYDIINASTSHYFNSDWHLGDSGLQKLATAINLSAASVLILSSEYSGCNM